MCNFVSQFKSKYAKAFSSFTKVHPLRSLSILPVKIEFFLLLLVKILLKWLIMAVESKSGKKVIISSLIVSVFTDFSWFPVFEEKKGGGGGNESLVWERQ